MRIVDISKPLDKKTITIKPKKNPLIYFGHKCLSYDFTLYAHGITYFETSGHVFRAGRNTDEFPLKKFFFKAALLKLRKRKEPAITGAELERCRPSPRRGEALLVFTGGGRRGRYFTRCAVRWMVKKGISLLGADLEQYDAPLPRRTGMFLELFKAEIPIIAGLIKLDRIRKKRFRLVVLPLNIKGVSTAPCRAVVIEE